MIGRIENLGYSIFGDSISTFRGIIPSINRWFYDADDVNGTGVNDPAQTWWGRVINREGGRLVSNASFSGAMVQGAGFPAGSSKARCIQVIGENGEQPDIVLVYMGINDYGWGTPETQKAGGSVSSPANYDHDHHPIDKPFDIDCEASSDLKSCATTAAADKTIDSSVVDKAIDSSAADRERGRADCDDFVTLFQQAYEKMLSNIRDVVPKAEIRCLTLSPARIIGKPGRFCYALRGVELDSYNDAIKRACTNIGAVCVDIRSLGLDYSSIDGTHPDLIGMRQLADMYFAALGDDHILDDYEEGMESSIEDIDDGLREKLVNDDSWSCYMYV